MNDPAAAEHQVVIERTLDAPTSLVWAMWTEPDLFATWYGPKGALLPVVEFDLRVGGIRRVCMEMQTPNGTMRMWFQGEHLDLSPDDLLVYTEQVTDEAGTAAHGEATEIRVELADADGRTRMVMTHRGIPEDSPGAAGWLMAFDKLEAAVAAAS